MGRFILSGHNIDPGLTSMFSRGGAVPQHLSIDAAPPFFSLDDDATPQTSISRPAGIVAGEYLIVVAFAYSAATTPLVAGKWDVLSAMGGGVAILYGRTATGDADDDFTVPAKPSGLSAVLFVQMARIKQLSGVISQFQDSAVFQAFVAGAGFPIKTIAAGSEPSKTLLVNVYLRRFETGGGHDAMSVSVPGDSLEIGQMVTSVPSQNPHYMWCGWSYEYQSISVGIAQQEIAYTINRNNNTVMSQRMRFKSV